MKYRILSLDASKIARETAENGAIGIKLPAKNTPAYFESFKNYFDDCIETDILKSTYEKRLRQKFSFTDDYGHEYTLALANVSFKYKADVGTHALRRRLYEDGFCVDGKRYVRYKRSAGSSREGKCLFIREELYKPMMAWSKAGIDEKKADPVSLEAYQALTLSALKGFVDIPLNSILFVEDHYSVFTETAVKVYDDGELRANEEQAKIRNCVWDGEALLDESVFTGEFADKHMLLLRNKFFKSCAFRTKLKKWFKDKNVTSVEQLKAFGGVTLATNVDDILLVATPSSLKYLKLTEKPLDEKASPNGRLLRKKGLV